MVPAAELAGPLDGDDVLGLLHDAQHALAAPLVPADAALLGLGDVEARGAEPHQLLDPLQGDGQPLHVGRIGGQDVERDPLRALGPDPG